MNIRAFFYLTLTSTFFLLNACTNLEDEPPGRLTPLHFNETERTIDCKKQNVVFSSQETEVAWAIGYIKEVMGTDTLSYFTTYNKNEVIERDWYKATIVRDKLTVEMQENQSDDMRELILYISAPTFTEVTLKIIQNNK
ncbi:hypothetical protein [Parabacteroides sp. Marseille-P3160]|uniref:hypothetical protein n=1 Tax=Parabacteroides sp. Marseille-P3160 TaxID=1917887 RepID=UPI0009BAF39E|nr:hypothetical protein [Parabacteroides sp. Marseille-P3160]